MRYETNIETGEVTEHPDAEPTPVTPPTVAQQIAMIEATITQRRLREALLGVDGGWLAAADAQIAELRKQL